jgi:hypothetical protein
VGEKISIGEFHRTPAYLALTQKQRRLLESFLETNDKVKSVMAAFSCAEKSARAMAHAYFKKPRIVACLAVAANGVEVESAENARQTFAIGSIISQDGKKFRVIAEELA